MLSEDQLQSASITKMITAATLMTLVDDRGGQRQALHEVMRELRPVAAVVPAILRELSKAPV